MKLVLGSYTRDASPEASPFPVVMSGQQEAYTYSLLTLYSRLISPYAILN